MDGQTHMTKNPDEVMDYAVAIAGMMYHAYTARQCAWMAEETIREFARQSDLDGVGSRLGEGLAQITGAVPGNVIGEILAGNHKIARKARTMGIKLPSDDEVYDEATRRGIVPEEWREKAFR